MRLPHTPRLHFVVFLVIAAAVGCGGRHNASVLPQADSWEHLKQMAVAIAKPEAPRLNQTVPKDYGVPIPSSLVGTGLIRAMAVPNDGSLHLVAAPGKPIGAKPSSTGVHPMSAVEGYCYWEVTVVTVYHWNPDGSLKSSNSYIAGVQFLGCDDGYSDPGGGGPLPSPAPTPCTQTGDSYVDNLIAGNSTLQKAMNTLSNIGITPQVQATTLPPGIAAQYNRTTGTLYVDQNNASHTSQNLTEVLFQELSHAYDEYALQGIQAGSTQTVTIGDYTITYPTTFVDTVNAFYHAFAHNNIMDAFGGSDQTGATEQMFGIQSWSEYPDGSVASASWDPNTTVKDRTGHVLSGAELVNAAKGVAGMKATASVSPPTSFKSAMDNLGATCGATTSSSVRRTNSITPSSLYDGLSGGTFDAIYPTTP